MGVTTYEATVQDGQIKLPADVSLPEHATVYIVIPDPEQGRPLRIMSPHFVRPEDADRFTLEVIEGTPDAELR